MVVCLTENKYDNEEVKAHLIMKQMEKKLFKLSECAESCDKASAWVRVVMYACVYLHVGAGPWVLISVFAKWSMWELTRSCALHFLPSSFSLFLFIFLSLSFYLFPFLFLILFDRLFHFLSITFFFIFVLLKPLLLLNYDFILVILRLCSGNVDLLSAKCNPILVVKYVVFCPSNS